MSSISPLSDPHPSPPVPATAAASAAAAPAKPKSKPRKRVNTAEKRHQHNAIERARRETLNTKFLTLARLLPSLANHRRPSKSAIVNGSISHITKQRDQRLLAASLLRHLCQERDELFEEVNEWRKASGIAPKEGSSNAWSDEMEQVCSVEKEVFGSFASMGGDGDDDGDDDMDASTSNEMPSFAMPSVNGLITPRSSTEIDPMSHPMFAQAAAQPAVNFNGMNWSQEFANQFRATNATASRAIPTPTISNSTPLPFGAFMSDTTDSPGTSNLANSIMLTPPTTADHATTSLYNHTPSPPRSSSAGIDEKLPQQAGNMATQQWTSQQLLFLQQIQQHQAQIRQHQQNLAQHYSAFPGNAATAANPVEGFTQSLINTMFPQQAHVAPTLPQSTLNMGMGMNIAPGTSAGLEQIQQWRKAALTSFLQQHGSGNVNAGGNGNGNGQFSMPDLRSVSPYQGQGPMMTPTLGMGSHGWSPDNAVEGF